MQAAASRRRPRRGQPRVAYKADSKPRIIKEILAGVPRSKAGPAAGVTKQTFYKWLDSDRQFLSEVLSAEEARVRRQINHLEAFLRKAKRGGRA